MTVIHLAYASDGGAGRAGRRASLACQQAGLASSFAFVAGEARQPGDIQFAPGPRTGMGGEPMLGQLLKDRLQWEFVQKRRSTLSNTLFSVGYPGIEVARSRAVETADILHLHWPTWMVTPRAVRDWLDSGRTVFWSLHDLWPMTGGCHYPAGCEQFRTVCLKCPQMIGDQGLAANAFAEKLAAWGGGGSLHIVTPSRWMADTARSSAILRRRPVHVVRNPVELDVFKPCDDREALRAAFGIAPQDALLFMGSFDLGERRKGAALLMQAVRDAVAEGGIAALLPRGGCLHLAVVGKSPAIEAIPGVRLLSCGQIESDAVMADLLGIADLVAVPSQEDNYPNMIVEAMACGTPCLGYAVGGIAEMIEDGVTGVLAQEAGSVSSLKAALLRFLARHAFDTTMRAACRASAERQNDPMAIGMQLGALYAAALGRPLASGNVALRQRMLAAFAQSPPSEDTRMGAELLRFPLNVTLAGMLPDRRVRERVTVAAAPSQSAVPRVLAVRTVHEHHSARSGPYQFARHVSAERFEVAHVAVPLGADLAGETATTFRKAGALCGAKPFGQQGNAWLAEAELLLRCNEEQVDLIHYIDGELNGGLLPSLPRAMFAGGTRPAFVATFHQPPDLLADMLAPHVLERLDAIVVLCDSQAEALRHRVAAERIFVVPHGIDTEFFHPARMLRARAPADPFRLLLVGHWLRDIAAARAACAMMRASGLPITLTVVSPDASLRAIDPSVHFLSGLTDEELRAAYWDADALFLPLLDATANNAVLEAMACGLPVISTAVGGVPEAVGAEAGILCAAGDAGALAAAAIRLAENNAERQAMGMAGRRQAEGLTWPHIARLHEAVYAAALARRATRIPAAETTPVAGS
jgi:glycosyltransferase involved in cell wall biosynthesis